MWTFWLTEGLLIAWYVGVLALMVRHLPKPEQRRVLYYGIWGAVAFRFIALLLAAILVKFWIFKVIGGSYLLYLAISHFLSHKDEEAPTTTTTPDRPKTGLRKLFSSFWGTVASVTLTDIAFSIDSILFAVGVADDFPKRFGENWKLFILFAGGVLGIITMRFAVRYFLILLDRFPGLATGAYAIVAWIGLKLLLSGLHDAEFITNFLGFPIAEIPEEVFWPVMIVMAAISPFLGRRPKPGEGADRSRNLDLFESQADPSADGAL
jgi:YkoY family integral membrane protein